MGRKSKIQKELEEQKRIYDELQAEYDKIVKEQEEERLITVTKINKLVEGKYFCGSVLGIEELLAITKLMFETKQNVKVGYNLYLEEKENGTI